jgi:hypothetical protein
VLNGVPFINHPQYAPQYFNAGTNLMASLPGFADTCQAVRAHKYHLFGMDFTIGGARYGEVVRWSDAAAAGNVPATWAPAANNQAGETVLGDSPGPLIDGASLRDQMMLYKGAAAYSASYVESDAIFAFRKVFNTVGVLTRNCIAQVEGGHILLTESDVVLTDGVQAKSIIDLRNRRSLFNALDSTNYRNAFVVYRPQAREVWICIPVANSAYATPTRAYIYNISTDRWGIRDLPIGVYTAACGVLDSGPAATWDSDSGVWNTDLTTWDQQTYNASQKPLIIGTAQYTGQVDAAADSNYGYGSFDIAANAVVQGIDCGAPLSVKVCTGMTPRLTGINGSVLKLRTGASMTPDGPITWAPTEDYIIGSSDRISTTSRGRYLAAQAVIPGGAQVRLEGFDLEVTDGGQF